jgi:hypothetical protein
MLVLLKYHWAPPQMVVSHLICSPLRAALDAEVVIIQYPIVVVQRRARLFEQHVDLRAQSISPSVCIKANCHATN